MSMVIWGIRGIGHIQFMSKGSTITGVSYALTLKNLKAAIVQKRRVLQRKKFRLFHDNAPLYTSIAARAAINECGFEEVYHPMCSPDLTSSDYYLFRNLKSHLRGNRYSSNNNVQNAILAILKSPH